VSITENEARPTESPPGVVEGSSEGRTIEAPHELEDLASELIAGAAAAAIEAEPTLQPPTAAVTTGDGVGLWVTNKQIDALYSTYAARFSWMHVAGSVWRRFSPTSDSGVAALAMLAAHARDRGRPVNYREEADQLVHEIYVW
jgi:hypothetical protein